MNRRQVHEEVLRRNLVQLTRTLNLDVLWPHLLEKEIFDQIWIEIIQGTGSQNKPAQRSRLISDLGKVGPEKWDRFISALYCSDQIHLAQILQATQRQVEAERGINSRVPGEGVDAIAYQESQPPCPTTCGYQPQQSPQPGPSGAPNRCMAAMCDPSGAMGYGATYLHHPHQVAPANLGFPPVRDPRTPQEGDDKDMQMDAVPSYDQYYSINSNPRGFLLVINNRDFEADHLETRKGTERDEENLKTVFDKFGFLYDVRRNQTAEQMRTTIRDFAKYEAHRNVDSCALAILTHGCEEGVYGIDGKVVRVREVISCFNLVENSPLFGKPKLIILGACRGASEDTGVLRPDAPGPATHLPSNADILISYATSDGLASWRDENKGSIFVQAFCHIFKMYGTTRHVLDMLVMVNNMVADWPVKVTTEDQVQIQKQLPQQEVGLRKVWMLNPPPPYR